MNTLNKVIENGNRFVNVPHIFVEGVGTFFTTKQAALDYSYSPNGVNGWVNTYAHEGREYFAAGYTNQFD